jgi:hypothetical protein
MRKKSDRFVSGAVVSLAVVVGILTSLMIGYGAGQRSVKDSVAAEGAKQLNEGFSKGYQWCFEELAGLKKKK